MSKYAIIFKNWSIDIQYIWQSTLLFPNSGLKIKYFYARKAHGHYLY